MTTEKLKMIRFTISQRWKHAFTLMAFVFLSQTCTAQDMVEVIKGKGKNVSGKITGITPFEVSIKASDGEKKIPVSTINEIRIKGEPPEIDRARKKLLERSAREALEDLQKIKGDVPPESKQEIAFLVAKANADLALRTGEGTVQDAGRGLAEFLKNHPQSMHFYPSTEMLGRCFFAVGKFDLAEKEFHKLTESKWLELAMKGHFLKGEALIEQNKIAEAAKAFQAIQADPSNDDVSQMYKSLAKVRLAKTDALLGKSEEAIKAINEIIKVENADNGLLFAYAYNSLGSAYLKENKLKEAMMAFLHTALLYSSEKDAHAEALYKLAQIWPKLEHNERANSARENLKNLHRNSFWATKLQ